MARWNFLAGTNYDNAAFGEAIHPGPDRMGAIPVYAPLRLEPGYRPYPFVHAANVVGRPAIAPTASIGRNPWDTKFGTQGRNINSNPDQLLPIGANPKTGM